MIENKIFLSLIKEKRTALSTCHQLTSFFSLSIATYFFPIIVEMDGAQYVANCGIFLSLSPFFYILNEGKLEVFNERTQISKCLTWMMVEDEGGLCIITHLSMFEQYTLIFGSMEKAH